MKNMEFKDFSQILHLIIDWSSRQGAFVKTLVDAIVTKYWQSVLEEQVEAAYR